jgi:hypothetical protein
MNTFQISGGTHHVAVLTGHYSPTAESYVHVLLATASPRFAIPAPRGSEARRVMPGQSPLGAYRIGPTTSLRGAFVRADAYEGKAGRARARMARAERGRRDADSRGPEDAAKQPELGSE